MNKLNSSIKRESLILKYAFFHWKLSKQSHSGTAFTYHKKTAYFWFFLVLLHEQFIEGIFFHFWLKKEDPTVALIVTAVHVYSVLYILGDYNLLRNSPIQVIKNRVVMSMGARRSLEFQVSDIESINPVIVRMDHTGATIQEKNVFHATAFPRVFTKIFGIGDDAKYEIVFKNELVSKGYFGKMKPIKKVFLSIDEPEELVQLLREKSSEKVLA